MRSPARRRALPTAALGLLAVVLAGGPCDTYDATIRWSTYGIPHVIAEDYGSVAYGYGYAFARDNICVLAEEINKVNGERAEHFGENGGYVSRGNGSFSNNLNSDFWMKLIMDEDFLQDWYDSSRPKIRDMIRGYANGYNRYLRDTGVENIAADCANGAWVRQITHLDIMKRFYQLLLLASQGVFIDGMANAQPPDSPVGNTLTQVCPGLDPACIEDLLVDQFPFAPLEAGSNAYAFGSDVTPNGRGVFFGNPHFPWIGPERFHQFQLTVPGDLNVSGMALYGVPLALIGFNEGIAWSHTVSTAFRFTPFELELVPGNPTQYVVDGEILDMTTREVSVCVEHGGINGACSDERTHTFYFSIFGPIFEFSQPVFEWDDVRAYAIRDANADNLRILDHFFEVNRADDTGDIVRILQEHVAIPWVNTIAADSQGNTLYADISVVPNVPDEMLFGPDDLCLAPFVGAAVVQLARLPSLDGRRTACNWREDPDAPQAGIFSRHDLPFLASRKDYVQNANDSYWMPHATEWLEGYDLIIGDEGTERALRPRLSHRQAIDRLGLTGAEPDGLGATGSIDLLQLQEVVWSNRNLAAELLGPQLITLCRIPPTVLLSSDGDTIDLTPACDVLEFQWDQQDDIDSIGAHIFREWFDLSPADTRYAVPFNPLDPVNTPNTLNVADPQQKQALVDAVDRILDAGIALDAVLGDIQTEPKGGLDIPIHGGPGVKGVFNAINVGDIQSDGYSPIPHGSSYIQTVTWDEDGPVAGTIVTYSQSTDPASPHYADQTQLYSQKQWNPVPFHEADILADPNLVTLHLTE